MLSEQSQQWMEGGRTAQAVLVWLARGCANTVEVFLHRRFGHRYLGIHSLAAIAIIFFYAAYWASERHDIRPIGCFLLFYVIAISFAAAGCIIRRWRGDVEHSRYSGVPRFFRPTTIKREQRIKEIYEPMLTIVSGLCVADLSSPPLGLWLVLAGVCMGGINSLHRQFQQELETGLQDAFIEQRARAEQARELQRRLGM